MKGKDGDWRRMGMGGGLEWSLFSVMTANQYAGMGRACLDPS
jgi:hypothetical protein